MSGNPLVEVHEKKIVRYYVAGESDTLKCNDKRFKKYLSALRHSHKMMKQGFTNVGIYKNTKIYKTERIL